MRALPETLSPCANVRRSCYSLMSDEPCFENGIVKEDGNRCVIINSLQLESLAETVTRAITKDSSVSSPSAVKSDDVPNHDSGVRVVEKCVDDALFEYASWDAENWHYTGMSYSRPHLPKEEEQKQRFERVALYIFFLDCINFCFWPVEDEEEEENKGIRGVMNETGRRHTKMNPLEYEHLAIALKKIAEKDDLISEVITQEKPLVNNPGEAITKPNSLIQAEDSYALAPQNLVNLSESEFLGMIQTHLSKYDVKKNTEKLTYTIPNVAERTRLIIELAQSLVTFHSGSATNLISKAHYSADMLVHLVLQSCPGFRDTAVDGYKGRWVSFYKRAQILCADLWAALGNGQKEYKKENILDYCHFHDIDNITTFADYRVPQLLRHLGVLEYSPSLGEKVNNGIELMPSSTEELYIRAGTVVAVDQLVNFVKSRLQLLDSIRKEKGKGEASSSNMHLWKEVNAVKLDWYLWNIGEKLDREGSLNQHHLVRTIFY